MQLRTCRTCGETKPLADYHRDKQAKDGRSRRCKVCACAASREWNRRNPGRVVERVREWRAANPDARKEHDARYRERHVEEIQRRQRAWRAANIEQVRRTAREYVRNNLDKANEAWHRRHARLMGATVERFTRAEIWDRDGGRCHICGRRCDANDWHLDHIVPLARGGEHSRRNVAVAHPFCNMSKNVSGHGQTRLWGQV